MRPYLILVGFLCVTVSQAATVNQVAKWSSVLYVKTFDFERGPAWKREHADAIAFVRRTPQNELARSLKQVLKAEGIDSTAGAGAAYLMALHGIDRETNLQKLIDAHQDTSAEVEDSLPEAIADIALQAHSVKAAKFLISMPNGEFDCEMQSMAIHKLFLAEPRFLTRLITTNPHLKEPFLSLLPFGAWNNNAPFEAVRVVARKLKAETHGKEQALYRQILAITDHDK